MLDKVVSLITCVSMNHQNQLEQMANGAMFATLGWEFWVQLVVEGVLFRPIRCPISTSETEGKTYAEHVP
jgi:hypothetical protein